MATKNDPKDNAPKKADVLNASEAINTDASSVPTTKQESEKNLFQISDELTKKIKAQRLLSEEYSTTLKNLVARKDEISMQLKPVARFRSKSQSLPALLKLTAVERKSLRAEKKKINAEIVKVDDLLYQADLYYAKLTGRSIVESGREELVNKANSKKYTGQNLHLFKRKLLSAINTFIQENKRADVLAMRNLAKDGSSEGQEIFKQEFGNVLDELDPHTYVLCSGRLSKMLYEAARLTFVDWNPKAKGDVEELTLPVQEDDE